jgi:hypothetical protein
LPKKLKSHHLSLRFFVVFEHDNNNDDYDGQKNKNKTSSFYNFYDDDGRVGFKKLSSNSIDIVLMNTHRSSELNQFDYVFTFDHRTDEEEQEIEHVSKDDTERTTSLLLDRRPSSSSSSSSMVVADIDVDDNLDSGSCDWSQCWLHGTCSEVCNMNLSDDISSPSTTHDDFVFSPKITLRRMSESVNYFNMLWFDSLMARQQESSRRFKNSADNADKFETPRRITSNRIMKQALHEAYLVGQRGAISPLFFEGGLVRTTKL